MKLLSRLLLPTAAVGAALATLLLASAHPALVTPALAPVSSSAPDVLELDPVHSFVLFKVKHLGASYAFGRFDEMSGKITYDSVKPESSSVEVTIQVASVDTNSKDRDDHVRSDSFFDVKTFPTATFKSKSIARSGERKLKVSGDLTLHGVTKPVTFEMENVGASDAMGHRVGFLGALQIKRSDYGMKFMLDKLGDDVELTLAVEGTSPRAK
jgi:polyisoprenoid-binding protein YceI